MRGMEGQTGADSKKAGKELFVFAAVMLVTDIIFLGLAAWRYELWYHEITTAAVILVMFGGIYVWRTRKTLEKHVFWLTGLHVFELAVILVSYQAEGMLRPVLSVPVLVGILAGTEPGIVALIFYSAVSAVICADPAEVVLLYVLAGFIGVWLFSGRKKGRGLLAGGISFFAVYMVMSMLLTLYSYMKLQLWDVVYSIAGGILQLLPVCCFLPFLTEGGFRLPGVASLAAAVSEDFPAIVELQERKPVLLKHSRLIAGLSAQAAAEVGANALLAQAGGLYHEIGQGLGEDCDQESLRICKKYRLPASVQDIIKEHNPDKKTPSSKEAAIVMLSDTIISTMEQNRRKNPQGSIDIPSLISKVFRVRENSGAFLLSGLTQEELSRLQEFYIRVLGRG